MNNIDRQTMPDEIAVQNSYIREIYNINNKLFLETGGKLYFYSLVMGCQMNARDSEKLSGMLTAMGYSETKEENKADLVIYNTCCVRENAENKVYGKLGYLKHLKEGNPNLKIVLCGCMMQQDNVILKIKSKYKFVDIVFGTFNIYKLPELLKTSMDTGETVIDIWKEEKGEVENLPEIRKCSFKASVNIMYGCNNFCSYCIVPYVRGRERSREPEDIINEISKLAASGTKEVTLLGQNVNSYGKTLNRPVSFAELLTKINEIEGLKRIRFMTSHPKDISDELILAIKNCDKVCKSIHLPFQSGSSLILKKMNRNYTKGKYLEIIRKLKETIPEITISTDIIAGFPGETEEDFNETIDVVNKVGFCAAFTFIYSKRTGTPASTMPDQIPEEVVSERFPRLLRAVDDSLHKTNQKHVGKTELVLVEEKNKNNPKILTGRNDSNILVHFEGDSNLIGEIVPIKILENKTYYLLGERISEESGDI